MTDRLLALYETADSAVIEAGRIWYPDAEKVIASLSREHQIGRPRIAAVVAVLSPQQRWRKNVEAARVILAGEPERAACYPVNVSKALDIIGGAALEAVIGGDKVTNFWANLIGSRTAVTVDVWAQRAALGRDMDHPKNSRYQRLVKAYRTAAHRCGETPREFQAIIWNAVRPAAERTRDERIIHGV